MGCAKTAGDTWIRVSLESRQMELFRESRGIGLEMELNTC